jgi:hypothetical protein
MAMVAKMPGKVSFILIMAIGCERLYSRSYWQQVSAATPSGQSRYKKKRSKTTGFWGLLSARAEVAG